MAPLDSQNVALLSAGEARRQADRLGAAQLARDSPRPSRGRVICPEWVQMNWQERRQNSHVGCHSHGAPLLRLGRCTTGSSAAHWAEFGPACLWNWRPQNATGSVRLVCRWAWAVGLRLAAMQRGSLPVACTNSPCQRRPVSRLPSQKIINGRPARLVRPVHFGLSKVPAMTDVQVWASHSEGPEGGSRLWFSQQARGELRWLPILPPQLADGAKNWPQVGASLPS